MLLSEIGQLQPEQGEGIYLSERDGGPGARWLEISLATSAGPAILNENQVAHLVAALTAWTITGAEGARRVLEQPAPRLEIQTGDAGAGGASL